MSKYFIFILSAFFFLFLSIEEVGAAIPFRDVSVESPYYQAVESLYQARVISDDGSGLFRPGDSIARDAFVGLSVSVSCRSCLTPTIDDIVTYAVSPFLDLSKTNAFYYCISYASKNAIVVGYPPDASGAAQCEDGTRWNGNPFCEKNKTTRMEGVAMLLRQANLWTDILNQNITKTLSIPDVTEYWYGYARKAIEVGLIKQKSDNTIGPDESITRGEFAMMAAKMLSYNQCMIPGSDVTLGSSISLVGADGQNLAQTTLSQGTAFRLVSRINKNPDEYNYTWKATDSISGAVVTGTGASWEGSTLGIGNWNISLSVRDKTTNGVVSTSTTTLTIHDGSRIGSSTIAGNPTPSGSNIGINGILVPSLNIITKNIKNGLDANIEFSTLSIGNGPLTYSWDFGDGTRLSNTSSTIQNHTYKNPGLYSVTVTMTDASGKTAQSSLIIEITGEKDSDGDGINDLLDACPSVIGSPTNTGCPIIKTNAYTQGNNLSMNLTSNGTNTSLLGTLSKNTCIVNKARSQGILILSPVCDICPCENSISWDALVRSCDILFPTILSPDKNTLYSRGAFYQIP